MKDYFEYQGAADLITGSRDATKEAFNKGIIHKGEEWMDMIKSRNKTSTYDLNVADSIVEKILNSYFSQFKNFEQKMTELASR